MAEYYKGERIADLLREIEEIKRTLDDNNLATTPHEIALIADGYTKLALAKAKLTALQGDNHGNKGKKSH